MKTGAEPGSGTFFCLACGSHLALEENDALPSCSGCGGTSFRRDSIFGPMQEHAHQTSELELPASRRPGPPAWLAQARAGLKAPFRRLAYRDDEGQVTLVPLEDGWLRIGRSPAADLRFDDPSVSRRHAIVACEAPKALRILDDRSLNGVQVNGESVEWSRLGDGDEVAIGRFRLYVLEA